MKKNILYRLVLVSTTFTFIFISWALIELAKNPVKGYEFSIYSSTPLVFWVSVILGLINGFFLTYLGVTEKIKGAHILGIFEILLVNFLVLVLHTLRNYITCMLRGDAASYVGLMKDVSIYGNIGSDFYPLVSIFSSQLHQITGFPEYTIANYLPAFFYLFSVLSYYCLSKSLFHDENYIIFAVVASTPLFFAWLSTGPYYMLLAVYTLPLFFYILINLKDWRFSVLMIIFCFAFPLFHPITAIIAFFYVVVSYLIQRYLPSRLEQRYISITLLGLSLIAVTYWLINQKSLFVALGKIIDNLIGMNDETSAVGQAVYSLDKLGIASTIKTLFFLLFDEITFYSLAAISIYFIIFKADSVFRKKFASIVACFIFGTLLIVFLFGFTDAHRPDRLINLNFNMMIAPVLVAFLLYIYRKNKLKTAFLMCLILLSTFTTYFSLYQSPFTMRANDYMTLSEYYGADWLICNKDPLINTVDLANPVERYADFIYGARFKLLREDLQRQIVLLDHFGFTAQDNNLFPMDTTRYLVLSPYDEVAYTIVWKDVNRFNVQNFRKVDECKNVFKVYDNSGFKSYLVRV